MSEIDGVPLVVAPTFLAGPHNVELVEVQLALVGCQVLDERAATALRVAPADQGLARVRVLQASLLGQLLGVGHHDRKLVEGAASAVSEAMDAVHGRGLVWWRMPGPRLGGARTPHGLDVPAAWGARAASTFFAQCAAERSGARRDRALQASFTAHRLAEFLEAGAGYGYPEDAQPVVPEEALKAELGRFFVAQEAAGGLQLFVMDQRTMNSLIPTASPTRPRLRVVEG